MGSALMSSENLRHRIGFLVAWLNFALLVACALKFIPIVLWGLEDLGLIDIGKLGFPTPAEQKSWAMDLISDTHLILFVWLCLGILNRWISGHAYWLPWRKMLG